MRSRRFRRRVTRVVIRLVCMLETSFRQILAINEKASLRAVSDTCRRVTGRCVRGVVSSDFGGFLNTEGLWNRVFILISSFISFLFTSENFWGERLGFFWFFR
jgi:hypothetical protein